MTVLLYISYREDLSENDKLIIDRQTLKNREVAFNCVKKVALNAQGKTRKVIIVIISAKIIIFNNLKPAEAIGLPPVPTSPVIRVQPSYHNDFKVEIAKIIPLKKSIIVYKSPKEILLFMYVSNPKLSLNQDVLNLVRGLRGGNFSLLGSAAFLGLIILIFSMGESFIPNPGWGLDRPNPFQPPAKVERYPPSYDLFFPKRTCFADRPDGSRIMAEVNPQSHREELTQVSTDVVPINTQISGFTHNKQVNLDKCLDEVNRRALQIGCIDFECSFERFKALATENGKLRARGAREAITILQGEMEGYYKNARREDYGRDILGPDFIVEGLGVFENITHVEVKNPVGSEIKRAGNLRISIAKQGKEIGKKIVYQKKLWSNPAERSKLKNINPAAFFPQSPNNILAAVDNFDVPSSEKASMEGSIVKGSQNCTNIIFLNNN